mmetsp:Transcript_15397/g.22613  ORF Transcript_15397/g.22613 Transcript_15397/m.22613 type:complete len:271 (+) Transcript_15397:767-1579(+)
MATMKLLGRLLVKRLKKNNPLTSYQTAGQLTRTQRTVRSITIMLSLEQPRGRSLLTQAQLRTSFPTKQRTMEETRLRHHQMLRASLLSRKWHTMTPAIDRRPFRVVGRKCRTPQAGRFITTTAKRNKPLGGFPEQMRHRKNLQMQQKPLQKSPQMRQWTSLEVRLPRKKRCTHRLQQTLRIPRIDKIVMATGALCPAGTQRKHPNRLCRRLLLQVTGWKSWMNRRDPFITSTKQPTRHHGIHRPQIHQKLRQEERRSRRLKLVNQTDLTR